ncbi:hypothetical protein HI914_05075 [Erysiphe necator]|nr:hypothetical protein HI914_05075 [Erysiphe necator]
MLQIRIGSIIDAPSLHWGLEPVYKIVALYTSGPVVAVFANLSRVSMGSPTAGDLWVERH